jgi:hypothetical protein
VDYESDLKTEGNEVSQPFGIRVDRNSYSFTRYLPLEDMRFADDRALLIGLICARLAVDRRDDRRQVIRRQILFLLFLAETLGTRIAA